MRHLLQLFLHIPWSDSKVELLAQYSEDVSVFLSRLIDGFKFHDLIPKFPTEKHHLWYKVLHMDQGVLMTQINFGLVLNLIMSLLSNWPLNLLGVIIFLRDYQYCFRFCNDEVRYVPWFSFYNSSSLLAWYYSCTLWMNCEKYLDSSLHLETRGLCIWFLIRLLKMSLGTVINQPIVDSSKMEVRWKQGFKHGRWSVCESPTSMVLVLPCWHTCHTMLRKGFKNLFKNILYKDLNWGHGTHARC